MSKTKLTREDIERMKKSFTDKGEPIPEYVRRLEKQLEQQESESKK